METPSNLNKNAIRFLQIPIKNDAVIDMYVDKVGEQYCFTAMEWTIDSTGKGTGSPRVNEFFKTESEAISRFDEHVAAWS